MDLPKYNKPASTVWQQRFRIFTVIGPLLIIVASLTTTSLQAEQAKAEAGQQKYFDWTSLRFEAAAYERRRSLMDQPLAAGMIVTVEPWHYNHNRQISAFTEDVILVTADGHEVLTARLARTPAELEALVRSE